MYSLMAFSNTNVVPFFGKRRRKGAIHTPPLSYFYTPPPWHGDAMSIVMFAKVKRDSSSISNYTVFTHSKVS